MQINNIGVVGLGLIGGSMAKTIKSRTKHRVLGYDNNPNSVRKAIEDGTIDAVLDKDTISECDLLVICLYPTDTIAYVLDNLDSMKKGALIVDCAGVKTEICEKLCDTCKARDVYFIGGHPMAGTEKSGYENSFRHLFDGATMLLCSDENTDTDALIIAENFFIKIGFGKITLTTAYEHDRIIAFTSQLAHVVSNAYVQSDIAKERMGFSAGSYQDLTRVAYLNEDMWTELFLLNKAPLVAEVRGLAQRLETFADLIEQGDGEKLRDILREGKAMKERVG